MADVEQAIRSVLTWEDAKLTGVVTRDTGGRTRFGIAENFHPNLSACLFYSSMGSDAALKIAEGIYATEYCQPLCIAEMPDQEVANKVLSLAVNCGVVCAAKMLQDALRVNGDGRIGPLTLHALDHANPHDLLDALRAEAREHYEHLIQENPSLAVYRDGWLRRADA